MWCLYDVGIKGIKISEDISDDEIELFLKTAVAIVLNCSQLSQDQYFNNPYVLTVVKTVKMLNRRASVNYKLIIEWLKKLDVEQLPMDDVKTFITEFGREVESASTREFYYYQLARANIEATQIIIPTNTSFCEEMKDLFMVEYPYISIVNESNKYQFTGYNQDKVTIHQYSDSI